MEYRELPGTNLNVSVLSLGTATFGGGNAFFKAWGDTQVEEATELVSIALEAGVNLLDTADAYSSGLAEEILGKAIRGRRVQVLISTKTGMRTGTGPEEIGGSRKRVVACCEASLRRLGTDHIDLYQLHAFDALTPIEETLRGLEELVSSGKVRSVGCSNYSGWHLMKSLGLSERLGLPRFVAHQAYYSLLAREYEWELMPLAIDQRLGTLVWSPLSGGRLSGRINRNSPAQAGSRAAVQKTGGPVMAQEQFFNLIDVLQEIAAEAERPVPQVALNWVLHRPTVSTLIIGARNEEQLRQNLGAATFMLSGEQMARLDDASATEPVYPYWHQRQTYSERNPRPV